MSERPEWMNDPLIATMEPQKLEFLLKLAEMSAGKSQKELMPYFMNALKEAKSKNLSFTKQEITLMIMSLKQHSKPEEQAKMDEILKKSAWKNPG